MIIAILILLSLSAFSISTVFGNALDLSLENRFVGQSINETIFANISSSEPSTVMFPGSPIQITEDSITMEIADTEADLVNLTDATESAILFMNQFEYIASINFTLDENWCRLVSAPARWTLRFYNTVASVYVSVNAITCSVIAYSIRWIGPSPYVRNVDSSILSVHGIELATLRFFEENNFTLSSHSHYITATLEYNIRYLTHNVYAVRFFEVVNNSLVDGNVIVFYLDVLTGNVVSFSYRWIYIDEIPTDGIIDKTLGKEYALDYINQESNERFTRITHTALLFKNFGSSKSISYFLCWAVYTDNSEFAVVYVNAKNGEIISTEDHAIISAFIDNTRLDLVSIVFPFVLSISVGLIAYSTVNHFTRIGQRKFE
jgi:hypothetical protein